MAEGWRLKLRNDLHLARKLWHCGMGTVIVLIYAAGLSKAASVTILLTAFIAFSALEVARLRMPGVNGLAVKVFRPIMRQNEVARVTGTPFYVGSVLLSIVVFPKTIAILSILFLAIGDPLSSIFGIIYGYKSIRFANGKTLIGTAAGMTVCFSIAFSYLYFHDQLPAPAASMIALTGGIAGGGAEMIPLDIDDNFSIPIVSGLAMWLAYLVLGW